MFIKIIEVKWKVMNNKGTLKKPYKINRNRIQMDDCDFIIEEFGIWEKIHCQYIKIFNSAKLQTFYFDCGIKKICKEVKQLQVNWYNEETKKLTHGFAVDLHILLKSVFMIHPILEDTIASIDKRQEDILRPLPIEFVFHTLSTKKTMESYPFTTKNLSKEMDVSQKADISQKNVKKIQAYLLSVNVLNAEKVDEDYINWIALYRVYDVRALEFLRRFYTYVSLAQDSTDEIPWGDVSISAVGHYLTELYNTINGITMTDDGLATLLILHDSLKIYDSKKFQLTKNQIITAWQNISSIIKKFQHDDVIFKLTMIAHKDPLMGRELDNSNYKIFAQFQKEMPERVNKLPQIISNQIIKNNMKETIEKTNKLLMSKITEIGIYTTENSKKVKTLGLNSFSYVMLFATVRIWLLQFVNLWILTFFNFLVTDNLVTLTYKNKVNQLYKNLCVFIKNFDSFYEQIQPDLIANKKMVLFLQGVKITEGEKFLVKVLVNDFNDKAELLVKELRPILIDLHEFTNQMISDLQNNHNMFFKNTKALKETHGDIEAKFGSFLAICKQLTQMLELTDKEKEK